MYAVSVYDVCECMFVHIIICVCMCAFMYACILCVFVSECVYVSILVEM